jgi:hypothetical protein
MPWQLPAGSAGNRQGSQIIGCLKEEEQGSKLILWQKKQRQEPCRFLSYLLQ